MTSNLPPTEMDIEQAAQKQAWSRKINALGVEGRLAKAREDLATLADFPGADLVDAYEKAKTALASYERLYRTAADEADPLLYVAQAHFAQQKAQVEVLRGFIIDRCDR